MEEPLLDFQKVCRVCLQEGETTSVFLEDISKKIMECTSVQVGQNDGLPGQICDKCSANLLISYQFKKLCEGSDIKLRRQLIKSESTSNKHVPENKTECINLDCDPFIKLYRGDNINPFVQLSEQPPLTTVNCKVEPEMEVVTDTENLERITVHCKVEPEMEVVTGIEDLEQTTVGCKVETKMEVVTGIEDLGQVQDGYDVEMNLKEQQQEDVVGLPYQWPPEQTVSVQQGVVEDELKSVDLDDEIIDSNNLHKHQIETSILPIKLSRFDTKSEQEIDEIIRASVPRNTKKTHDSIWKQFTSFCKSHKFELTAATSIRELGTILKSWAFNMKRVDGRDYKESAVKVLWNVTAKLLQDMYFTKYKISFDPFKDIEFKGAREARNAKRRVLQKLPEMRKSIATILLREEIIAMSMLHDDKTPDGLQRRFYDIASYELGWRGGEASKCLISFFIFEKDNNGEDTGRMIYNTAFGKAAQGGNQKLSDNKWLTPNKINTDICPVRLYNELLHRRPKHVNTKRLFLTPNPFWKDKGQWYKNCPIGPNTISKWTRDLASNIGLKGNETKITNRIIK